MDADKLNNLGYKIIGAAYEVRRILGSNLYEASYEQALQLELELRGVHSERQVYFPVYYKGMRLEKALRVDLLVEDKIPVELKALNFMGQREVSQILEYLKFGEFKLGYLINFKAPDFTVAKDFDYNIDYLDKGIYRFVNRI